jgi:hypothetical protein
MRTVPVSLKNRIILPPDSGLDRVPRAEGEPMARNDR